jgi:putative membrane protein
MLLRFILFWATHTLTLWVASVLLPGLLRFDDYTALAISGLLFGVVNTVLKPPFFWITLPLTVVTLGLFLLVINASLLLLVAWLVPGFHIGGFWHGVGLAIFVSLFSFVLNKLLRRQTPQR